MAKALVHRSNEFSEKLKGLLKSRNWKSMDAPSSLFLSRALESNSSEKSPPVILAEPFVYSLNRKHNFPAPQPTSRMFMPAEGFSSALVHSSILAEPYFS